ncbi:MAG: hypothetical protein U0625_04020 [Phycisphaerales bacterium]
MWRTPLHLLAILLVLAQTVAMPFAGMQLCLGDAPCGSGSGVHGATQACDAHDCHAAHADHAASDRAPHHAALVAADPCDCHVHVPLPGPQSGAPTAARALEPAPAPLDFAATALLLALLPAPASEPGAVAIPIDPRPPHLDRCAQSVSIRVTRLLV